MNAFRLWQPASKQDGLAGKSAEHATNSATSTAGAQSLSRSDGAAIRRGSSKMSAAAAIVLLPFCLAWWCLAFAAAWALTLTIIPSVVLARRLYWACPFIPYIFKKMGGAKGWAVRMGFEASYCINVLTRLLTLPLRRDLPSFYIVGFPKCGTTSLSEHLKRHPGIAGPAGLPYHEALSKETHFFEGVLGRDHASSATLYRSFFPIVAKRWWVEHVKHIPKWMCFDACPVHACLPYVARRIASVTPNAKIIIMLRDPVPGVFSAEVMLSDMGAPLQWPSLTEPVTGRNDERFQAPSKDETLFWERVANLDVQERLPAELPESLYFTLGGVLRCGQYADLLEPYLACFPPANIMVINLNDFKHHTEDVVRDVLRFVGASEQHFTYEVLPASMQNNYQNRCLHPTVDHKLRMLYRPSISRLQALLGRDLGWPTDVENPPGV